MTKEQDENETNNKTEILQADTSQIVDSYPPYTTYEVTENVIDIPDDRTPAGPIVTNFSIKPNLNLGKPINNTNIDEVSTANIKTKKNRELRIIFTIYIGILLVHSIVCFISIKINMIMERGLNKVL
uniref:Uncharacterized protein n=1 Tax=Heliothis virescens TaxID=7102 RepID=A0A2A4JCR0_HELVI